MLDYLVVGLGLAGLSFCERLEQNKKSFKVVSDDSQQASLVASGLYNPVILKRFTLAWKADEQLPIATSFYAKLEEKLGVKVDDELPVLRRFTSVQEQNLWFEASEKPSLSPFLASKIARTINTGIDAPFGLGLVNHCGRIATNDLVRAYSSYLDGENKLVHEKFQYPQLEIRQEGFVYKGILFKRILFAEGFGLKSNPFFAHLPLVGTKGELLTIKARGLGEQSIIKSSVFLIPLGNDNYRVGATYKWKDKGNGPTESSKEELLAKVKTFLKADFEVVNHTAGIRPTVTDRRPLVGKHPKYKNMFVLNGLGSRGVLIAPYASLQLYNHIDHGEALSKEIDVKRFNAKYIEI